MDFPIPEGPHILKQCRSIFVLYLIINSIKSLRFSDPQYSKLDLVSNLKNNSKNLLSFLGSSIALSFGKSNGKLSFL